jgi:UDP-N-acetyl-2-amino-2-deoxyglucuronate dehydrogenase
MKNIGLIGCGGIANSHARILSALEGARLAALCDIEPARAEGFREKYAPEARTFTDYREMYDALPLDVVYICLPPFAHRDEVDLAAERGIHVFIEKPIALDLETASRMVDTTSRAGVRTQVGFMSRFGEAVERVKGMLESGEAGPPGLMLGKYYCNSLHAPWWRDRAKSGGQIVEQIIHTYDVIRYFLGEPETVYASTANLFHRDVENYTSEDVSATVIRFRSGAVAAVAGSNGAIPGRWINAFELVAGRLTAVFSDPNHASLTRTDRQPSESENVDGSRDVMRAETLDLMNAIDTGRETRTPMIEGYRTLELVLATAESGDTRQPISIPRYER